MPKLQRSPAQIDDSIGAASEPSLDDRYDTDAAVWRESVEDAAKAWLGYEYPPATNSEFDAGTILSTKTVRFVQNEDGSGSVFVPERDYKHYYRPPERVAWRYSDGAVVVDTTAENASIAGRTGNTLRRTVRDRNRTGDDIVFEEAPGDFVAELLEQERDVETEEPLGEMVSASEYDPDSFDWRGGDESSGVLLDRFDGTQVFVGHDFSSHRNNEIFGFVVPENEDVETAAEAISLLKPDIVEDAEASGEDVKRQGEWWLIPGSEPRGSVQKGGVGSKPFNQSPLDSHVARDWATDVPDGVFLDRLDEALPSRERFDSPQAAVNFVHGHQDDPMVRITTHDLRAMAEGIHVRGSFRHRRNEHYMEKLDGWHRTVTHDVRVYTADREYQASLD